MKAKKLLALAAAAAMVISLAGCGGSQAAPAKTDSKSAQAAPAAEAQSAPAAEAQSAAAEASAPATELKSDAIVLRIGTGTGGKDKQVAWMEEFERQLEAATEGAVDVQCYPAGQLGTMAELVQGTVDGTVDAACFPTNYFSTVFSGAAVIDLPNMFPGGSLQLHNILMTQDTLYEKEFESHGLIPVSWLLVESKSVLSKDKIESLADMKNKIIWTVPSTVTIKEVELLGAVSSTINVGELAPSLQNGTVEGAFTGITLYLSQSLQNSGGNYLLEILKDPMITIFGISKHWWDNCPEDLKPVIEKVANDTVMNFEVDYIKNQVQTAYTVMQDGGTEVVVPSEEFSNDIANALEGMDEWFLSTYPEAKEVYDDMVERVAADTNSYDPF